MRFYFVMSLAFMALTITAMFFKAEVQAASCLVMANMYLIADKILKVIEEK